MSEKHTVSGTVEQRPTARLVCNVESISYRVFDPSHFAFCPICGGELEVGEKQ